MRAFTVLPTLALSTLTLCALLTGCSSTPEASEEPVAAVEPSPDQPATGEPASAEPESGAEPAESAPEPAAPAESASQPPAAPAVQAAAPAPPAPLRTDEDRTIYALGLILSRNLAQFDLSPAEVEIVKRALSDAARGNPAVKLDDWGPKVDPLARARGERVAAKQKQIGAAFLVQAAAKPGAEQTASGLVYRAIEPGSGESPAAADTVRVNYRGTLIDGTEFDSSYKRNQPAEFPLTNVIPCWTEGVQKMRVGGKSELICPAEIAYGASARPSIPANSTLIFEIELLAVVR